MEFIKFDILNRFSGNVQFTAEIECAPDAPTSIKIGLSVRWAVKHGARLVGARLDGARLGDQWIIQGATRSDGYSFFLQKLTTDKEPMVKAGCRYFTLAQAQKHWETTRKGQKLLDETREIVRCMVSLAQVRGLIARSR